MLDAVFGSIESLPVLGTIWNFITSVFSASQDLVGALTSSGSSES